MDKEMPAPVADDSNCAAGSISRREILALLGALGLRKDHFKPAGKPAPPRPRRLAAFTSSTICAGVISSALRSAL